ncbi:hypothetical protein ACEPAI_7129 [Sanghuangporus weigelae]
MASPPWPLWLNLNCPLTTTTDERNDPTLLLTVLAVMSRRSEPGPEYLGFDGDIPPPHRLSRLYNTPPSPSNSNPYSYSNSYSDSPRAYSPAPSPSLPAGAAPAATAAAAGLGTGLGLGSGAAAATATTATPHSHLHSGFQPVPTHEQEVDTYTDNPFMPSSQFASNQGGYNPMDSGSAWLEKQERSSSRAKWIVIGSILGILAIIGVGVGVGVGVSKSKGNNSTSSSSGSSSSDDASDFTKNSALKQSFYGFAYTPEGSQLPDCGNSLDKVITDIQLLSQLTTRIRLYGADCNQSALVLEAIERTKVNMSVYLGNYNIPTDAGAAYERQRDTIKEALETYGTDHVAGITVGNEFMLNWVNSQGVDATAVNQAIGNQGAQLLIQNITDTRNMLSDMGLSIPVGTSDAGSYFNDEVLAAVDYGMANVHPWFANTTIDDAASWTASFFTETNIAQADSVSNRPQMYIAETGWPTESSDAGNESNGASTASVANLQTFLNDFVCQSNANGTGYFYFEFADEPWKDAQFGGVEGWWGLFNSDRTMKDVTIPDCSS